MRSSSLARLSAYQCTNGKPSQREGAGDHRKPLRAGGSQTDEQQVAGHRGHEHVTETQDAGRVEDSGEHRQRQQQRRQWTVALVDEDPPESRDRRRATPDCA
jgi:hypothetical protein